MKTTPERGGGLKSIPQPKGDAPGADIFLPEYKYWLFARVFRLRVGRGIRVAMPPGRS